MYNPFTLINKKIFITGASSGIGQSIAIECSKMGALVFISGRDRERLNQTFNALEGKGHNQLIADLNDTTDISNMISELPELDGIVHCAGITKTSAFQFMKEEDLFAIMHLHLIAPVNISQRLLKAKKLRKGASIVFISSISGIFCSYKAGGAYSASKGAINGIAKAMAIELAEKKIRVNSVCSGMIDTNFLSEGIISEEQLKEDMKRYPLKRYGQPREVAYAAIYLLSDASTWVTGTNLLLDGGYTLL